MALAQQLAVLREQTGPTNRNISSGSTSVLFETKEASKIPLEDVAALGANGAAQLTRLDRRFSEIEGILFNGKVVDRVMLDKEKLAVIEAAVQKFCLLASPYFLLRPTQKCIEWLLRGWSSAEFAADIHAIILLALPFHETKQCVQLLRALLRSAPSHQKDATLLSMWKSLRGPALQGVSPSRKQLASVPSSVFHELAKIALKSSRVNVKGSALFSFYTSLVCERLSTLSAKDDDLRRTLFLDAVEGLSAKLTRGPHAIEFRVACIVVLSAIAQLKPKGSSSVLNEESFKAAGEAISKHLSEIDYDRVSNFYGDKEQKIFVESLVFCLFTLCGASNVTEIPENVYRFLVKFRDLGELLAELRKKHGNTVMPLTAAFGTTAAKNAYRNKNYLLSFERFVLSAPLEGNLTEVMYQFFIGFTKTSNKKEEELVQLREIMKDTLKKLLRSPDNGFLEAAVTKFLREKDTENRETVVSCVLDGLLNTKLQLVAIGEVGEGADAKYESLLSAITNWNSVLRLEGVKALNKQVADGPEDSKHESGLPPDLFRSLIFQRILDDDHLVQTEALKNQRLRSAKYAFDVLTTLESLLRAAAVDSQTAHKKLIEEMINLVGHHASERQGKEQVLALSMLIKYLVIPRSKKTRRKFQKPSIDRLSCLGGELSTLGDVLKGMPRSTEAGELDLCYNEKPLVKALATGASRSTRFHNLLLQTLKYVRERLTENDFDEAWWWLWIAHLTTIKTSSKQFAEITTFLALDCLEKFNSNLCDDRTSPRHDEEDLDVLFDVTATGNIRIMEILSGKLFVLHGRELEDVREKDVRKAYELFIRKGLFTSVMNGFRIKALAEKTQREEFFRSILYSKDSNVSCEFLGFLVAQSVSQRGGGETDIIKLISDLVAFASSPHVEKREAACASADFLLRCIEKTGEMGSFAIAEHLLQKMKTRKSDISSSATAMQGIIAELTLGVLGSSDDIEELDTLVDLLLVEAGQCVYLNKTSNLLHACIALNENGAVIPYMNSVGARALVRVFDQTDSQWNRMKIFVLKLYNENTVPLMEDNTDDCRAQICRIAAYEKHSEVQKAAIGAVRSMFLKASRALRRTFLCTLCVAMRGSGTDEGAQKAPEALLSLPGLDAKDLAGLLANFPLSELSNGHQKKSRTVVDESQEVSVGVVSSLLDCLSTSRFVERLSPALSLTDLIRPLIGMLEGLVNTMENSEDLEELNYICSLVLVALSLILNSVTPELALPSKLLRKNDVEIFMSIALSQRNVSSSVKSRALDVIVDVARDASGLVGLRILDVIGDLLANKSRSWVEDYLGVVLNVKQSGEVSLSQLTDKIIETLATLKDRDESTESILKVVMSNGGAKDCLRLWGKYHDNNNALFKALGGRDLYEVLVDLVDLVKDIFANNLEEGTRLIALVGDFLGSDEHLSQILQENKQLENGNRAVQTRGSKEGLPLLLGAVMGSRRLLKVDTDYRKACDAVAETLIALMNGKSLSVYLKQLIRNQSVENDEEVMYLLMLRLEVTNQVQKTGRTGKLEARPFRAISSMLKRILQDESSSTKLVNSALEVIDRSCANIGTENPEPFDLLLEPVLKMASNSDVDCAFSAILCLSTLIKHLQNKCVKIVPGTIEIIGAKLIEISKETLQLEQAEKDNCVRCCSVALETLLNVAPQFFSGSSFETLLNVLISDIIYESTGTQKVLLRFAEVCEPRFLLPTAAKVLSTNFTSCRGASSESSSRSIARLLKCIAKFSQVREKAVIKKHRMDIVVMVLRAWELRRRLRQRSGMTPEDLQEVLRAVESAATDCFILMSLRLREGEFKDTFHKFLEWSEAAGRRYADVAGKDNGRIEKYLDRSIVLVKCLNALLDKLTSIFVPYFAETTDRLLELLGGLSLLEDPKSCKGKEEKSRKRKLEDDSDPVRAQLIVATELSCRALEKYFKLSNETISDKAFERTMKGILESFDMDSIGDQLIQDLIASFGSKSFLNAPDVSEGRRRLSTVNRQALMKSRTKKASLRLRSVNCAVSLVKRVGEDYLSCLPETMTFLADLIDDEDPAVEMKTREFIHILEELSGEPVLAQLKE